MKVFIKIAFIILLLTSCKNSEKTETEVRGNTENQVNSTEFRKIRTNNSLELKFQILDENNEQIAFSRLKSIAEFPGGFDSLATFIQKNFAFPEHTINFDNARVETTFSIDTLGNVVETEIKNGFVRSIDNACLNVITRMPNWKPAELIDNKKVKMKFLLPLKFQNAD